MKRLIICLSGFFLLLTSQNSFGQEANNPLLYSYQAVMFGDMNISHDPATLVMPGVAYSSGFGSYLENPASAALYEESFGSFGLAYRNVMETTRFLGNSNELRNNQVGVPNLGFIYQFPTVQGSFAIGAGYSQHSFYNRAMSISGRNTQSTMTDFFKIPGSPYEDMAFDTYAIDWGDEEGTFLESIFRIGFTPGDFPGITQEAEVTESGYGGEYSFFVATEFLQNLMVGASIGLRSGRHRYDRVFLEIDEFNDYDGDFIDSSDDGEGDTDIDNILLSDQMRNEYYSFSSQFGLIYRIGRHFNVGSSYTFRSRLTVDEEFDARIASTFDNGVVFRDDISSEFSYTVSAPARLRLGASLMDLNGVHASFSAEYVDYSATRIEFDTDQFEDQRNENEFISESYRDVWNLRGGLAVDATDQVTLRAGYGVRPSRFSEGGSDRQQISAGIGFAVSPTARLDLGGQYSWFSETSVLYEYEDHNFMMQNEMVDRDAGRMQIMATFRIMIQ